LERGQAQASHFHASIRLSLNVFAELLRSAEGARHDDITCRINGWNGYQSRWECACYHDDHASPHHRAWFVEANADPVTRIPAA
jgi:hypothetical protein